MTIAEENVCEQAIRDIMVDYGVGALDEEQFCNQLVRLHVHMQECTNGLFIFRIVPGGPPSPIASIELRTGTLGKITTQITRWDHYLN